MTLLQTTLHPGKVQPKRVTQKPEGYWVNVVSALPPASPDVFVCVRVYTTHVGLGLRGQRKEHAVHMHSKERIWLTERGLLTPPAYIPVWDLRRGQEVTTHVA